MQDDHPRRLYTMKRFRNQMMNVPVMVRDTDMYMTLAVGWARR